MCICICEWLVGNVCLMLSQIVGHTVIAATQSVVIHQTLKDFLFKICDFEKLWKFVLNVQFLTYEIPINKSKVASVFN